MTKRSTCIAASAAICALLVLPGCLAVAAAGAAAGAVYVTADDASEVTFERSWEAVFDASVAALDGLGSVETRDPVGGRLMGWVDSARVEMKLSRPTPSTVKLRVEARRHAGVSPASDVAERVARAVLTRL